MQSIKRKAGMKTAAVEARHYMLAIGTGHRGKLGVAVRSAHSKGYEDDCSACDKLPKQIDDMLEGALPQHFKRPKMASDIVAR